MGQGEIRKDAEELNKESHGNTPVKEVDSFTSSEAHDSHNRGKNEPTGRPEDRDIHLAVRIGKESGIAIEMAVRHEKRWLMLEAWKAQAEVVSKTIGNATRAEHAVLMSEFTMNRVDVVVVVYSGEIAESCVA